MKKGVDIPIIITTSNKYLHLLPVFCFLFNKFWWDRQPVTIVGYDPPQCSLPDNFTFHSLGKQGSVKEFSTDLRRFFEAQPGWFIWMMEDTFLKAPVNFQLLEVLVLLTKFPTYQETLGRINLTAEAMKQTNVKLYTSSVGTDIHGNTQTSKYRLSTQPSIWNKKFLLHYLAPGLSPWDFETQHSINDGWKIMGPAAPAVLHNEGVRRHDIHALNLDGIDSYTIIEMKTLGLI
jgi:hypothetical protein